MPVFSCFTAKRILIFDPLDIQYENRNDFLVRLRIFFPRGIAEILPVEVGRHRASLLAKRGRHAELISVLFFDRLFGIFVRKRFHGDARVLDVDFPQAGVVLDGFRFDRGADVIADVFVPEGIRLPFTAFVDTHDLHRDFVEPPLLTRLGTDEMLIAQVIAALLESQFELHKVDSNGIYNTFDGPTFARTHEAFYKELISKTDGN